MPWNNDELWFDFLIAIGVGIVLQVSAHANLLGFASSANEQKANLYSVAAQIAATLLGFLLAAVAIVAISPKLEFIKSSNNSIYRKLIVAFRDSMYSAMVTVAYCFIAWILDRSPDNAVWFVIGLAMLSLLGIRILRVISRLQQVLFI